MGFDEVVTWFESGEATSDELMSLYNSISDTFFADDDWRGEKHHTIVVDEEVFSMRFKGNAQLRVIGRLREWLSDSVAPSLGESNVEGGDLSANILALSNIIDPRVLVGLGVVLTGKESEWVEENFDLEWIIGAAEMAYGANKVIKRIVGAFFTGRG